MRRFVIAFSGVFVALAMGAVDASAATAATSATAPQTAVAKAVQKQKAKKRKKQYVGQLVRFNNPNGNAAQRAVIDVYIKRLIRHTPKNAEINVSLFRLRTSGMAKELVTAHKRGAKVRIVLDSDSPVGSKSYKDVYDYLRRNLGGDTRKRSWIVLCPPRRGCIAPAPNSQVWAKNHNKFYAFSHTFDSRNVVVQTSGNATGGMYGTFNDSYTMVDSRLYGAYRRYFYDLAKRRANANYYRTTWAGWRGVSYFPKATGDPVVDELNKVSCLGGRTRIRVSTGILTRTGVAAKLAKLDDDGCKVQVVTDYLGVPAMKALQRPSWNGIPEVRYFTPNQARAAHSKYVLIDGIHGGRFRKLVLTGSHSYTPDALRNNDESLLTLYSAKLHDAYVRNFNTVFKAAAGKLYMAGIMSSKGVPTVPDNATEDERPEPNLPPSQEVQLPPTEQPGTQTSPDAPDTLPQAGS